jgi:hypothetical protein
MFVANADNARELAEKVREVICEEWQGAGGSLQSAVVYERLLEEGVEVLIRGVSSDLCNSSS